MWNDQLLILMDTVVDGMLIIDNKGIMQVANKSLKTIFGYELEDLCGKLLNGLAGQFHPLLKRGTGQPLRSPGQNIKIILGGGQKKRPKSENLSL